MIDRVTNQGLEKYRSISDLGSSAPKGKDDDSFLRNLQGNGVVFEKSNERQTTKSYSQPVKVEIRNKKQNEYGVNRAARQEDKTPAKGADAFVNASNNAFDKIAKVFETIYEGIASAISTLINAFIPANPRPAAEEKNEEGNEESHIMYEIKEEEFEDEAAVKEEIPGFVNTLDNGDFIVNTLDDDKEEIEPKSTMPATETKGYTDEDIERFLKNGDIEGITRVVTQNGRKSPARSTALSGTYTNTGAKSSMQVDSRDEATLMGRGRQDKFQRRI